MRFGRGGWRGQTVKGTVRQQTGNKWMVDWDLPSTSASITSRSYGRLWFKNNAKTDDSVNAGSIDGLAGSEEEHSSSSSSSQDSDGSSSDEDEEGGPRERSQRSSFAQRSLNFAENGGGPSSPSAASGAASGAPPAASPPAQAEGGVGPSPTRQSPRQQSQLPAHALLKTENVIWKKLDEGISIDPAAGHAWMRPGMTWRTGMTWRICARPLPVQPWRARMVGAKEGMSHHRPAENGRGARSLTTMLYRIPSIYGTRWVLCQQTHAQRRHKCHAKFVGGI